MDYASTPKRLPILYINSPLYFLTFNTCNRQKILCTDKLLKAFVGFCQKAYDDYGIAVGRFVIMPDHIHLFVRGPETFRLSQWISSLKSTLTRELVEEGLQKPIWQRGFFDHIVRHNESYREKWQYVFANPMRAGLIDNAEEWKFAGEIVIIDRA